MNKSKVSRWQRLYCRVFGHKMGYARLDDMELWYCDNCLIWWEREIPEYNET